MLFCQNPNSSANLDRFINDIVPGTDDLLLCSYEKFITAPDEELLQRLATAYMLLDPLGMLSTSAAPDAGRRGPP